MVSVVRSLPGEPSVTVGHGKTNPVGQRAPLRPLSPESFAEVLRGLDDKDDWISPHTFAGNRRQKDRHESAIADGVDVDHYIDGRHAPWEPLLRERVARAARGSPANVFHLTPRGLRFYFVLSKPLDGDSWRRTAEGAVTIVYEWLKSEGLAATSNEMNAPQFGLHVDTAASLDRARFFWGPRGHDVVVLEEALAEGDELAAHSVRPATDSPEPRRLKQHDDSRSWTKDVDQAAARWNADHPLRAPRSGGQCPTCGHKACFGTLGDNPDRWACFSASHNQDSNGCGLKGEGCYHGDALDIEAHRHELPRIAILRRDGYLPEQAPRSATATTTKAGMTAPPPVPCPRDRISDAVVIEMTTRRAGKLLAHHCEHLRADGLSDATIDASGCFSVTDPHEAAGILGWKGDITPPVPALAFPHFGKDAKPMAVVLCPDQPREIDGRLVKDEHPKGRRIGPYFPPIGGRLDDSSVPLLQVNGIKEALAVAQANPFLAVISWPGVSPRGADLRKAASLCSLDPMLAALPLQGRQVFLARDGSGASSDPILSLAEARTAQLYAERGADVRCLRITQEPGTGGLEDLLVRAEDPGLALSVLLESSVPSSVLLRVKEVADPFELLEDGSFQAALSIAPTHECDRLKALLCSRPDLTKSAINDAIRRFSDQWRTHQRQRSLALAGGGTNWADRLLQTDGGAIKSSAGNALLIVENADELSNCLAYNEFSAQSILVIPPPWNGDGSYPRPLGDDDTHRTTQWIEERFRVALPIPIVGQSLVTASHAKRVDPVRDYLESTDWDGIPRLDHFLPDYFGAEDTEFNRVVGRKWMISAVARVFEPGSQVDHVLVLEGNQGIGKSSALRVLGGDWFTDEMPELDSKDGKLAMQGAWIVELSELAALKGASGERMKAFITRRVDRFRPPYGKHMVEHERRCVFAATTNDHSYLKDSTGSRRFWPVRCSAIRIDLLVEARDQLWAEAVERFRSGEPWWFDTETEQGLIEAGQAVQDVRQVEHPWGPALRLWVEEQEQDAAIRGTEPYLTTAAAMAHLGIEIPKCDKRTEMQLADIFRAFGYSEKRRCRINRGEGQSEVSGRGVAEGRGDRESRYYRAPQESAPAGADSHSGEGTGTS